MEKDLFSVTTGWKVIVPVRLPTGNFVLPCLVIQKVLVNTSDLISPPLPPPQFSVKPSIPTLTHPSPVPGSEENWKTYPELEL